MQERHIASQLQKVVFLVLMHRQLHFFTVMSVFFSTHKAIMALIACLLVISACRLFSSRINVKSGFLYQD